MKFRYLHIICLIIAVLACSKAGSGPEPVAQPGGVLSIGVATRSGEPELPTGDYGLFGIEYAYDETPPSWNPSPSSFYHNNKSAFLNNDTLDFGSSCRYPINDYLAVFLYYPHNASATPNYIPVNRIKDIDSGTGDTLSDRYPDYIAGKKNISVVGGAPNIPSEATVEMSHLMSRVRFQTKNAGATEITLLSVKLVGITWEGSINPQITGTAIGFFTPLVSDDPGEEITLIKNFVVPGNLSGSANAARPIQIDPKYNYSDTEVAHGAFNENHKYYMLVPPLDEEALKAVELEVAFSRYGTFYTATVKMKQVTVSEWLPGHSYCYTLTFSTYMIEHIDARIEPWLKELYTGTVVLP